jgi:NDMA-dependent alcohol dehydrogenase
MQVRSSVVKGPGQKWETVTLELAPPGPEEVLVRMEAAGLCHSDEHLRYASARYPIIGGHEGSGVVEAVGDSVTRFAPGDHVVAAVTPSCGVCRYCQTGRSPLCDLGATIGTGQMPGGRFPATLDGEDIGGLCMLGTFSERLVTSQYSLIKSDPELPHEVGALLSCGVPTGWGSAVSAGGVRPGEIVVVVGVGGVGVNAVQGAALGGASVVIALDPVEMRREFALTLGATHAAATAAEAGDIARSYSPTGADLTIVTAGNVTSDIVNDAFSATGKAGRIVLTGVSDLPMDITVGLPGTIFTSYGMRLIGTLLGDLNPQTDVPYLVRLYREGRLKVEELISKRYTLDQVQQGYEDQEAGKVIRGVVVFEH